ncbi:MAG: Planktothrix phage PaV-LD, partial [Cyanobacteriota bacterium]
MMAGEISYSDSMTSEPTATLVYTGVSSGTIAEIERAYPMGQSIFLYGVPMEVNNRSYSQDSVKVDRVGWLDSYTVTISLQFLSIVLQAKARYGSGISGRVTPEQSSRPKWQEKLEELGNEADLKGFLAYSDGLRVKTLGFGSAWKFTREQVLEVGGSSVALPSEGYNKAPLTWGTAAKAPPSPNAPLTPKKPERLTLTEGDINPEKPPDNDAQLWLSEGEQAAEAKKLRDMSSNFDQSGPTKFKRVVTTVDGTPESESYELWGYVYRYIDIFDEDGYPRKPSEYKPADFWRKVEERTTTHTYSNLDSFTGIALTITDSSDPKRERRLKALVHPDFQRFVSGGPIVSSTSIKSETQYLLGSVTKGRKLTRLVQESDTRNTLDPTDPWVEAELFEPTWTPYEDRTAYLLKPSRGTFTPEDEQLPFRVEFAAYDSLEPRIQELVEESVTTSTGQVAILYPDPNFVES